MCRKARRTGRAAIKTALALALVLALALALALKMLPSPRAESGAGPLVWQSANQTRLHRRRQTETDGRAVPDCDNGFFMLVCGQRQTVLFPFYGMATKVALLGRVALVLCVGCVGLFARVCTLAREQLDRQTSCLGFEAEAVRLSCVCAAYIPAPTFSSCQCRGI